METSLQYRTVDYFNEHDLYLFEGINCFLSKVEVDKDKKVFTVKSQDRCQYKATTVRCINLKELK